MTGPFQWTADFSGDQLPVALNTLRTPTSQWWAVDAHHSALFLQPRPRDLNSRGDPSLVARRQQHSSFSSTVRLPFQKITEPADAGLVAFQNERHSFFLGVHLSARSRTLFLEKRDGTISKIASANLAASAKEVQLKVEDAGSRYRFYYRAGNGAWRQLGGDQDGTNLSTRTAGGFVGTYIGLFARSLPAPSAAGDTTSK